MFGFALFFGHIGVAECQTPRRMASKNKGPGTWRMRTKKRSPLKIGIPALTPVMKHVRETSKKNSKLKTVQQSEWSSIAAEKIPSLTNPTPQGSLGIGRGEGLHHMQKKKHVMKKTRDEKNTGQEKACNACRKKRPDPPMALPTYLPTYLPTKGLS